jgi:hypothetical protein
MPTIIAPSKPFPALVFLIALCISLQVVAAAKVFSPVYHFNNGTVDDTKKCQSDEWSRIQIAAGNAIGGAGRVLLRSPESHRRLPMKCSDCGGKPLCLAAIGIGCALLGKRRLMERQDVRSLNNGPCSSKSAAIDLALTTIAPTVSAPCQALLNAPRNVQCAEYTKDCDIFGFTLMNSFSQTEIAKLNTTDVGNTPTTICSSKVGTVTIRADTNFFLGTVTFTFSGKRSTGMSVKTETNDDANQPYVAFGKMYIPPVKTGNGTYVPKPKFNTRILYAGVYTVSAFSQDNPTEGKTATFTIKQC